MHFETNPAKIICLVIATQQLTKALHEDLNHQIYSH